MELDEKLVLNGFSVIFIRIRHTYVFLVPSLVNRNNIDNQVKKELSRI